MTTSDLDEAAKILREAGYSVIIFSPKQLHGVDPVAIENILKERALHAIQTLSKDK